MRNLGRNAIARYRRHGVTRGIFSLPKLTQKLALMVGLAPAVGVLGGMTLAGVVEPGAAAILVAVLAPGVIWFLRRRTLPEPVEPQAVEPVPSAIPQDILEGVPDPVILLSATRSIIAANRPARDVLGVGRLGGDLALSLRHPDVLAAVDTVSAGVPSITEEIALPVPVPRTFTLHVARLPNPDGSEGPQVIIFLHDETRAKKAEQSRADFVANASHELRSPLSALIGFIETLRGPASDDAEARERFLGIMHDEALRMARLVEDLMSLSRVEINEHVQPRGHAHIDRILSGVADALLVRAEGRGMAFDIRCPDDLPAVAGDADQLTQVFHNLVDNAIKYGRADTPIGIVAQPVDRFSGSEAGGISVSVTDKGEGVSSIHLPRLTERFYRIDEGRSRRLGGTGLGLAIVKHIVSRHRGQIRIKSREGQGTTVTVFLPAATGDDPGNSADSARPAAGRPPAEKLS